MFTQVETRLAVEKIHNALQADHHARHAPAGHRRGSRIFVPPFDDPYDPNVHPILAQGLTSVGQCDGLGAGRGRQDGASSGLARYDLWAPARQYMVYHGQPRILTEIASVDLADPFVNPAGRDVPLGPQDARWNYPAAVQQQRMAPAATSSTTASPRRSPGYQSRREEPRHLARELLQGSRRLGESEGRAVRLRPSGRAAGSVRNLRVARHPAHRGSRDPPGQGAVQRRRHASTGLGSWVIKLAQPYGAFAKTMLERQQYPDLRLFPGGPPKPPYDVTGHTLGLLMGVEVDQIDAAVRGEPGDRSKTLRPALTAMPAQPRWAYLVGPESNGAFIAVARLQAAGIATYRAARAFETGGRTYAPGTWIVPPSAGSDAHPGGRVHRGRVWWSRRPTSPCRSTRTG